MPIFKILKYFVAILILLIFIGGLFMLSYPQQSSDEELTQHLKEKGIDIEINYTEGIRSFKTLGFNKTNTTLLFVHGAPGSGDQFNPYLADSTLLSKADIMSLDRPGYGKSQYGSPQLDILSQAQSIINLIHETSDSSHRFLLISHSYGGPVCAIMSALDSAKIKGHLMLCPVIDPDHEKQFWFSGIPLWWPFHYISSGAMKVAAHEKLSHVKELKKVVHLWKTIKTETIHIQGEKDWLAPIENANYVKDNFDPFFTEVRILDDESHFIPFNKKDFVVSLIMEFIDN